MKLFQDRFSRVFGAVVAGVLAALFAINSFGILTPPRSLDELLRPTAAPTRLAPAVSLATSTPISEEETTVPDLIYSETFAKPGKWPSSSDAVYDGLGLVLYSPLSSDFLAIPLPDFQSTNFRSLALTAEGIPVQAAFVEYGVYFWHSSDQLGQQRFVAFIISSRGTFRLRSYAPFTSTTGERVSRWNDLLPETRSNRVRTTGEPNRLRLEIEQGRVRAFLDGFEVLNYATPAFAAFSNRSDADGQVGLLVTGGAARSAVRFTRFEILNLQDR